MFVEVLLEGVVLLVDIANILRGSRSIRNKCKPLQQISRKDGASREYAGATIKLDEA